MTNAITVSGANKHYGEFAALDNVDFVGLRQGDAGHDQQ